MTAPGLDAQLRAILKSQLHASLATLRDVVTRCPDDLWLAPGQPSAFWQLAYHTVFFGHLYLHQGFDQFERWAGHQKDVQHEDGLPGPADPTSTLPLQPEPYTKAQVLEYCALCDAMVDGAVDGLDLSRTECGFAWYSMSKLEHQLVNLRHIQHHAAQLAERLRLATGTSTRWVAKGAAPSASA